VNAPAPQRADSAAARWTRVIELLLAADRDADSDDDADAERRAGDVANDA
jgi:hypothetical protein